jgi:hypothetical protein
MAIIRGRLVGWNLEAFDFEYRTAGMGDFTNATSRMHGSALDGWRVRRDAGGCASLKSTAILIGKYSESCIDAIGGTTDYDRTFLSDIKPTNPSRLS